MKYYVVTYGCQMNLSDSERIAAVLGSMRYKPAEEISEADLIVINACSVRQPAIDRIYGLVEKLKKNKKEITTILAGCILKKDENKFSKIFDYVFNIKDLPNWPKILKKPAIHKIHDRENFAQLRNSNNYFDVTPKYSNKFSANVPIMTGCNNFCSYCVVPHTRGREISRPAKEVITEIKNLIKKGYKKIWLIGQNVNSYKDPSTGSGQAINFPKLLKMVNDISGEFVLNFTTSHPKDFSDELIETMVKCKKLSTDLNLPIQSGDDEVLKRMNRPYTVLQYKNLVKKIRKALPNIRLSTDIIVGFPGETKKQFNNTVKTLKEIGYGVAFINKYSPREGTAAAKMKDDVAWAEKKRREKILINLVNKK
ncbi:MAG: tRNA (N6-isopentenyl adenosine(37)-C2)-methylthiotransferase MiaB [Candidatus Staskawiczbacteria bacterium RIFOXYD2_FULL_37_9]|uniref:tRNA-2-methylthio-N(6)-dimethylallyladenosine synthase n=1 Tax=Candidatus Staskawiczbacteria bacterium RIFOXYB1_FULL_37_44 TaxID=1802223 RepID=A0A1G2IVN6_9BACT|nr:MAG: tRNA (N6-isopentenyl adenosine(37)-C2)-methylthiotransferase MiaB [Candidatus Staskawiczbacteria bacterium RIFOXYB1_FULL_37_44]OGZ83890.1 MAG: tRNA (N6-isopentenyl adenosine(37)-C2)-methylthiotransferase MiaB [Candidatus Staskawiczbacteria bacterium RIFOXYC1_FULL_37_52]OGZ87091.1 MAG: tRNA (N6-isopentenyl adenosine(37)-C2)-methylthiotransferase MiaB [Candidatus Staskawiczbacteria bacterium RIFOXYC2_FULL_37_19]OGZ89397.1 MAG: tRNA (N6-isopentenyl adenosine(37)-C2)-methylthiotransferase Mi